MRRFSTRFLRLGKLFPPPPPPPPPERVLTNEMVREEPDFEQAEQSLRDRLQSLEARPDSPRCDGSLGFLKKFLWWSLWRDPGLLDVLETYARCLERAAGRNGIPFSVDDWIKRVTGGGGLKEWRSSFQFQARRTAELGPPTGAGDWCRICGSSRGNQNQCRCRLY